jgi:hypothetical protein
MADLKNLQVYIEELANEATRQASNLNLTKKDLSLIKVRIGRYLSKIDEKIKIFTSRKKELEHNKPRITSRVFQAAGDAKIDAKIIKEGLLLTESIRMIFTGQKITYSVVIPYYGEMFIRNFDLKDILDFSGMTVDRSTMDVKLKLNKARADLLNIQKGEKLVPDTSEIERLGSREKEVYQQLLQARNRYNANQGHVTEAFFKYREKHKNKMPKGKLKEETIEKMLRETKQNVTKGFQGGDYKDIQIKSYSASIANFSYIRSTLLKIYNALSLKDMNVLKQTLKENFTNSKASSMVDKAIAKEAQNKIDKTINEINKL